MNSELSGQQLGSYILGRVLGSGGMGTVYESYQAAVKRPVAVKVLPAHLAQNPGYLERFNREVELAAKLEHPHILPIHDYGTDKGISYIVMRLLPGGSLEQRLGALDKPSTSEALQVLGQVAGALDYAHKNGIIHRDLKASNVLFDRDGNAYLTDFGIAKALEGQTGLTSTGQVLGTPAYMAPEQWRGESIDARADVYAMGVMAYHVLTGQLPFDAPTPYAMMHKHLTEIPKSPTLISPTLPAEVNAVLQKALAKQADDRYSSARAFVEALQTAFGTGISTQHTGFLDRGILAQLGATQLDPPDGPTVTPQAMNVDGPTITPPSGALSGSPRIPSPAQTTPSASGAKTATWKTSGLLTLGLLLVMGGVGAVLLLSSSREEDDDSTDEEALITEIATSDLNETEAPMMTPTLVSVLNTTEEAEPLQNPTVEPTNRRLIQRRTATEIPSETSTPTSTRTRTATTTPTETYTPSVTATPTHGVQTRVAQYATETAVIRSTETVELGYFYATQTAARGTDTPTHTETPTTTPTLTATATQTPTFTNTPTPTATPTEVTLGCQNSILTPRLTPGELAYVLEIPPEPNLLKNNPGLRARRIGAIQPGETFLVLNGPVCQDDINWWEVQTDAGQVGWTGEGQDDLYWVAPIGVTSNSPATSADASACLRAPALRLSLGETAVVDLNDNESALLLTYSAQGTGRADDTVLEVYDNARLLILDGPVCGRSRNRWRWLVRDLATSLEGWASEGVPSDPWMCSLADPECGN